VVVVGEAEEGFELQEVLGLWELAHSIQLGGIRANGSLAHQVSHEDQFAVGELTLLVAGLQTVFG
jgi:hypothetical protein